MPPSDSPTTLEWFPQTRQLLGVANSLMMRPCFVLCRAGGQALCSLGFLAQGRLRFAPVVEQLQLNAIRTLPIAFMLTGFTGLVLGLQLAKEMVQQGGGMYVGGLIALAMVRELGPVLAGFAVLALVGSSYATEIGAMRLNNQLEALSVLHVNPIRYLTLPRVVACMLSLPWVAFLATVFGLFMAMWASQFTADVSPAAFWDSVYTQIELRDLGILAFKGVLFGFVISLFSCSTGFYVQKSSQAIGQAATQAVVWSFILLAIVDYVLSACFY